MQFQSFISFWSGSKSLLCVCSMNTSYKQYEKLIFSSFFLFLCFLPFLFRGLGWDGCWQGILPCAEFWAKSEGWASAWCLVFTKLFMVNVCLWAGWPMWAMLPARTGKWNAWVQASLKVAAAVGAVAANIEASFSPEDTGRTATRRNRGTNKYVLRWPEFVCYVGMCENWCVVSEVCINCSVKSMTYL